MKTAAIVQARMGSTRFPGKVAKQLGDTTVLGFCLQRLKLSKCLDQIIVATTDALEDRKVIEIANSEGVSSFSGENKNVLKRYYQCAVDFKVDTIVRITSDCPFIDPILIDRAINFFTEKDLEYFDLQTPPQYPDGLDFEIFTFEALTNAHNNAVLKYDLEHVTPFIKRDKSLRSAQLSDNINYSSLRWTIDEPSDLKVLNQVLHKLDSIDMFSWQDILNVQLKFPEIFMLNSHIKNNEGSQMNTGEKLWNRAKEIIPGGNDFFSKRPELFLPKGWPTYYERAKGVTIWDLDGNQYMDMSIMGIGTNSLGYTNDLIDNAVIEAVAKSNMSTFNPPEQVYLAEKLIELHPWFDMAKFARTGGEINAVAIRVARAFSGKDKVVICGYHGWHDWYLSTNIRDKNSLNEHLLAGLKIAGVPSQLNGLTQAIKYNNFDDLKILEEDESIGVLIMEVMRSEAPKPGYLETIREICDRKQIVLIFDECTTGFRETFGGLHKKFAIYPDLATFGKALGNGYPITALLGKEKVMKFANESFISSTFWSDRIGFVAGLKTLEVMESKKSWETITRSGEIMQETWREVFSQYNLDFKVSGIPALSTFLIKGGFGNSIKTFITQEFLKLGILASNLFYPCTVHSNANLMDYKAHLRKILAKIDFENLQELGIKEADVGFERLN